MKTQYNQVVAVWSPIFMKTMFVMANIQSATIGVIFLLFSHLWNSAFERTRRARVAACAAWLAAARCSAGGGGQHARRAASQHRRRRRLSARRSSVALAWSVARSSRRGPQAGSAAQHGSQGTYSRGAFFSFLDLKKIKISKIYVRFEKIQKYTPVALWGRHALNVIFFL